MHRCFFPTHVYFLCPTFLPLPVLVIRRMLPAALTTPPCAQHGVFFQPTPFCFCTTSFTCFSSFFFLNPSGPRQSVVTPPGRTVVNAELSCLGFLLPPLPLPFINLLSFFLLEKRFGFCQFFFDPTCRQSFLPSPFLPGHFRDPDGASYARLDPPLFPSAVGESWPVELKFVWPFSFASKSQLLSGAFPSVVHPTRFIFFFPLSGSFFLLPPQRNFFGVALPTVTPLKRQNRLPPGIGAAQVSPEYFFLRAAQRFDFSRQFFSFLSFVGATEVFCVPPDANTSPSFPAGRSSSGEVSPPLVLVTVSAVTTIFFAFSNRFPRPLFVATDFDETWRL